MFFRTNSGRGRCNISRNLDLYHLEKTGERTRWVTCSLRLTFANVAGQHSISWSVRLRQRPKLDPRFGRILQKQIRCARFQLCTAIRWWYALMQSVDVPFYSARNARIASAVLATAIPSVCLTVCPSVCPSVTRRYCVKTTARSTMQFSPLDSKMCLVL